jgi:SPASM domain peptide maturase of grasp-with-spasm system
MNKYFRLFANCIPVQGARRSIICDTQRRNFEFIPNGLYTILTESKGQSIETIKADYGGEYDKVIDEYFAFLIEHEFGFWCEQADLELFPDLNLHWDEPAHITNAIIDLDEYSKHPFEVIIPALEELGCKHIQIRVYTPHTPAFYEYILQRLENRRIISVEIITPYLAEITEATWLALTDQYPRLHNLILHSAPENKKAHITPSGMGNLLYVSQVIDSDSHCGIISPNYFSINIKTFTEAQKHNSCLNRKIGIDVKGEIKNCPSLSQSYGNIRDTSLHSAIAKQHFKDLWEINKDQIEACKDCEFRYICTDCRAFITNKEDKFSKPAKCGYNPHEARWE